MSEQWIPSARIGGPTMPFARVLYLLGAIAICVGMFAPVFRSYLTFGRRRYMTYSVLDLRAEGAPGITLLLIGAVLLVVLGLLPRRLLTPMVQSIIRLLALAEVIGGILALAIGYPLITGTSVQYPWGSAVFVAGLVLVIGGTDRHWYPATT